mgnify:CR=1 FL=1|jgi:hypothetical protein
MKISRVSTITLCTVLLSLLPSLSTFAQENAPLEGNGVMSFELFGPEETPEITGHWTLIRPGNERTEGDDPSFSFQDLSAGNYTFTSTLPEGASATIEYYENGDLVETLERPQASFQISEGANILLKVQYTYTRTGIVAVNSEPAGLAFDIKGPNDMELSGTTPASFENFPIGQYAAYFEQIEGCPTLPTQSDRLVKDSRITLQVEVVCDNLKDSDLGKNEQKNLEYVTVTIEGKTVLFEDARVADWFAPYVYKVAKAGVVGGYKDRYGEYNGRFGPGDNVTIAQLSKIAHKIAGIDETKVRVPTQNAKAKNQWFEAYFASAEQKWWEIWRDKWLDPSRPAKRSEVIATILRALDVRMVWAQGKTFGDVLPTHKYANAIETAAVDGLIDSGGNFRPDDAINRAEVAKIIANAIGLYIEDTLETQGGSR